MERYGEVIWIGFTLWTLGVCLTCTFDLQTPIWAIALVLVCQGGGIGFIFQPTLAQRAVVISNRNFLRSVGGAVGLAISGAVLQNTLKQNMPSEFMSLALSSYSTPDLNTLGASPAQVHSILEAYAKASRMVFIMNAPFMGICLLGSVFIKDHGLQRPEEKMAAEAAQVREEKSEGDVEDGIKR
jgi:uncharacterized protein YjeT (DUF2065 family)